MKLGKWELYRNQLDSYKKTKNGEVYEQVEQLRVDDTTNKKYYRVKFHYTMGGSFLGYTAYNIGTHKDFDINKLPKKVTTAIKELLKLKTQEA